VTEGQATAHNLEYATLPLSLVAEDQKLLSEIQVNEQRASESERKP
jgi:hypothetical protein